MNVKGADLIVSLFHIGEIFVSHYTACDTKEEMYLIETPDGDIVFEVTKRWFDVFKTLHKTVRTQVLPCGCIQRTIIPNDSEISGGGLTLHRN